MPHLRRTARLFKTGRDRKSTGMIVPKEWADFQERIKDDPDSPIEVEILTNRIMVAWPKGDEEAEKKALRFMEKEG